MILAEPVVTAACFFAADGAMGETVARHSPRPEGNRSSKLRTQSRRNNADGCAFGCLTIVEQFCLDGVHGCRL
jgi:hypothetical protein